MLSLFLGLLGLLGAWSLVFATGQETKESKMDLKKIRVYILGTMFIVAFLLLWKIMTPIKNTTQNNLYSESDVIFKERVAGNVFENMNKSEHFSWISSIPYKGGKKEINENQLGRVYVLDIISVGKITINHYHYLCIMHPGWMA